MGQKGTFLAVMNANILAIHNIAFIPINHTNSIALYTNSIALPLIL